MPLHPEIAALIAASGDLEARINRQLGAERLRALIADASASAQWDHLAARDIAIAGRDGHVIALRVHAPPRGGGPAPILLYFHGGGWVTGDLDTHADTASWLARDSGCVVVAVHYRLAPEHPFPQGLHDCLDTLRWVAANASELGGDARRIALIGDSAGGNLAAATSLLVAREGGPRIGMQILLYPATDLNTARWPSMEQCATGYLATRDMLDWYYDQYAPPAMRTNPLAAPIHAEDLAGQPPTFIATAEYDALRDEGEAFARALCESGALVTCRRYLGQIHGFLRFPETLEGTAELRRDVLAALRGVFGQAGHWQLPH